MASEYVQKLLEKLSGEELELYIARVEKFRGLKRRTAASGPALMRDLVKIFGDNATELEESTTVEQIDDLNLDDLKNPVEAETPEPIEETKSEEVVQEPEPPIEETQEEVVEEPIVESKQEVPEEIIPEPEQPSVSDQPGTPEVAEVDTPMAEPAVTEEQIPEPTQPTEDEKDEFAVYNVFIGNLSFETAEDDIREAFSKCGEIDNVEIIRDRVTGRSKGFGFIDFTTSQGQKSALSGEFKDVILKGKSVEVKPPDSTKKTLFVGNLPNDIESAEVQAALETKVSHIVSVEIKRAVVRDAPGAESDNKDGIDPMRSYAFVQFESNPYATHAKKVCQGLMVRGHSATMAWADTKRKDESEGKLKAKTIYVSGFGASVTSEELGKHFESIGSVANVNIVMDPSGKPRGFAFVEFEDATSYEKCLENRETSLGDFKIMVAPAFERGQRGRFRGRGGYAGGGAHFSQRVGFGGQYQNPYGGGQYASPYGGRMNYGYGNQGAYGGAQGYQQQYMQPQGYGQQAYAQYAQQSYGGYQQQSQQPAAAPQQAQYGQDYQQSNAYGATQTPAQGGYDPNQQRFAPY